MNLFTYSQINGYGSDVASAINSKRVNFPVNNFSIFFQGQSKAMIKRFSHIVVIEWNEAESAVSVIDGILR